MIYLRQRGQQTTIPNLNRSLSRAVVDRQLGHGVRRADCAIVRVIQCEFRLETPAENKHCEEDERILNNKRSRRFAFVYDDVLLLPKIR